SSLAVIHIFSILPLLFFFLTLRRPPSSTLFPYTTLFRSIRALNGRFNTSITHAYSIVIGSKHITLNATGGGFKGDVLATDNNTRSEERFSRNAETDIVCRLLLEKKKEKYPVHCPLPSLNS